MNYYVRLAFTLLILTFSIQISGQFNYKTGYVITLQNDTISGLIRDGGGIRNSKVCLFKPDKKSKAVQYFPSDIKSYRFTGDKYYSSKELKIKGENKFVFTEVLLDGELNLYYCNKNKEVKYYFEKEKGNLIELRSKEATLTGHESRSILFETSNYIHIPYYKDTLYSVLKDSKKALKIIESSSYNHKSLINVSKAYLKETCKRDGCIRYEKDLYPLKTHFGVFSGIQISQVSFLYTIEKSDIQYSVPVGVFLNVPIPQINEKLSLQLEMVTNSFNFNQLFPNRYYFNKIEFTSRILGFPLLFKYQFTGGKFSPTLALGKEFSLVMYSKVKTDDYRNTPIRQTQYGRWLGEFGLNYKVTSDYSFFTNIRFQSHSEFNYPLYKSYLISLHLGVKF